MFVRIARRSTRAFTSATNCVCFVAIAAVATIASAQVQPPTAQLNYGQRQPVYAQQPAAQPQSGLRQPSGIVQTSGTDQPASPVQQAVPQMQQPVGQMQSQPNGQVQSTGNVPQLRAGGVPLNVVPQNGNQQVGTPQQQPGAQPRAQTLPNGAPLQPQVLSAAPPWQLTPQEEADLDRLLTDWEKQSDSVKNFECKFTRWEYDPALANNGNGNLPSTVSKGIIKYSPPDKGLFRVDEASVPDPKTGQLVPSTLDLREHWTCDGDSIYMVDHQKKLIIESKLPPEMKGKAIINGPLPFVFGAKSQVLKDRYYMRLITPKDAANEQVWLEARPKFQKDAANYSRVQLILTKATLQPAGIQIFNPGAARGAESRTVIQLTDLSVNGAFANIKNWLQDFSKPAYVGYKHVLNGGAAAAAVGAAPAGSAPGSAPVANGASPQPPAQAQKPTNPQR
jgi:TIGR03009 family protein